jgi:hypothetical protein
MVHIEILRRAKEFRKTGLWLVYPRMHLTELKARNVCSILKKENITAINKIC